MIKRSEEGVLRAGKAAFWTLLLCLPASILAAGQWLPYEVRPFHFTYPKFFLAQTLLAVWGTFILLDFFTSGKVNLKSSIHGMLSCMFPSVLLCYALWNLAGLGRAVWPYGARMQFLRETGFLLIAFASFLTFGSPRRWRKFAIVFLLVTGLAAILQSLGLLIGVARSGPGRSLAAIYRERPFLFANKNYGCALFITAGIVAVGLALSGFYEASRKKSCSFLWAGVLKVVALCAVLGLFVFMLVASGSLAGFIAAAVAVFAYVVCLMPRIWRRLSLGAVLVVVFVMFFVLSASDGLSRRVVSGVFGRESTASARAMWWLAAADMMGSEIGCGLGPAGYPASYYRYAPSLADESRITRGLMATHPHNELLRVGAELGLPGFMLYALVVGIPFVFSCRVLFRAGRRTRFVGFALWAGALAFFVQSLFSKAIAFWDFALPYWMLLGLLASASLWQEPGTITRKLRILPRKTGKVRWLAFVVLAMAIFFGWWHWAVLPYRSMKALTTFSDGSNTMAMRFQGHTSRHQVGRYAEKLEDILVLAQKYCLWPTEILRQRFLFGDLLVKYRLYDEGARHLEWVDASAPGMLDVRRILARAYAAMGDKGNARHYFIQHIDDNPGDTSAYAEFARIDRVTAARLLQAQVKKADGFASPERVVLLGRLIAGLGHWDGLYSLMEDVHAEGEKESLERLFEGVEQYCRETGREDRLSEIQEKFPFLKEKAAD